MTQGRELSVVEAKKEIAIFKEKLCEAVKGYVLHNKKSPKKTLELLLLCQKHGNEYFNYVEEFVGNSNLLGAHNCPLWAQGFAEDCAEVLKSIPGHFEFLQEGYKDLNEPILTTIQPGNTAFANMQRLIVKYLEEDEVESIRKLFEKSNLPTYGFKHEAKDFLDKKMKLYLAFGFGVFFIIIILLITLFNPYPSVSQTVVFRTILALAAAAAAAVIPGFVEVKIGNWLKAGGAIAVFVIVYFSLPAMPDTEEKSTEDKGKVSVTESK